jgi:uncharacterized phage protein gp47/JayE
MVVTSNGFTRKTYSDIMTDMETALKHSFGSDVDLSPGSPINLITNLFAVELSKAWLTLEDVYNSAFLNTSAGTALENIGAIVGVSRDMGSKATGEVTFLRTTPLPSGSIRTIPAGTIIKSNEEYPLKYVTTQSVYMYPTINDETATIIDQSKFSLENYVGEVISISGSNGADYVSNIDTVSGRVVYLNTLYPENTNLSVTYKPISITAPVEALNIGYVYNAIPGMLTLMETQPSFIHSVTNEYYIVGGKDVELDIELRDRIAGTAEALGNATKVAIDFKLRQVDNVSNVVVKDVVLTQYTENITASGSNTFTLAHTPLYTINSISGSVSGTMTYSSFHDVTGVVTLNETTSNGEDLEIVYHAESDLDTEVFGQGLIKVFVAGGEVADIVNVLENTRAAGIQAIGYNSGSSMAYGSALYPFSWFYRLYDAIVDIQLHIYYEDDVEPDDEEALIIQIREAITNYVNSRGLGEKVWKNQIEKVAMNCAPDIIASVDIIEITMNGETQDEHPRYLVSSDEYMPTTGLIVIGVQ